jgi:hypothetical protein
MVHWFPSSQEVPGGATGFEHIPVAGAQAPATWQASAGGGHLIAVPPPQIPFAPQISPVVHLFPSSHGAPTATGFEHTPVVLLHIPTV